MAGVKIVFHLPLLKLGGVAKNAIKLSEKYIEMGHEVVFLVHKFDGEYKSMVPEGVTVENLKVKNIITGITRIHRYFKENNADIIISSRDLYNSCLLFLKKIFKYDFILIATCHTNVIEENKRFSSFKQKVKTKIYMLMSGITYKWADAIIAVSDGVRKAVSKYSHLPVKSIYTIYNPIIDKSFYDEMIQPVELDDFKQDRNHKTIMSAGRLTEQKNFQLLIKAFKRVIETIPTAKLVIFGEGEQRDKLNEIIFELGLVGKVILPGFEKNPIKYMKNADLFVLSSDWEGFGNALAEALATGVAVVSTDCLSGPAEILEGGIYGKLVPVGDEVALASAMIEALNENSTAISVERRITRSQAFAVDTIAKQYLSIVGY